MGKRKRRRWPLSDRVHQARIMGAFTGNMPEAVIIKIRKALNGGYSYPHDLSFLMDHLCAKIHRRIRYDARKS